MVTDPADMVLVVSHVRWIADPPRLRQSILISAFEGWNDAGEAATLALGQAQRSLGAEQVAEIDAEAFYDFTEARPDVVLDGSRRTIEWPTVSISVHRGFDVDLVFVEGVEPQLRWRTFAAAVAEVAETLDVAMSVTLGALITEAVHTRPTTVYAGSAEPDVCSRLDLEPSTYEGPTGIVGVLNAELAAHGIETASLWGAIPSYVPNAPSPKAALALLERLEALLDVSISPGELPEASAAYEEQIDRLVADDDDTAAYVAEAESRYDETMRGGSGDALIAELEQFLRDQS